MNGFVRTKFDDPVTLRKKGVIGPHPDKISGTIARTPLPNNDPARADLLAAINFDAQAFRI